MGVLEFQPVAVMAPWQHQVERCLQQWVRDKRIYRTEMDFVLSCFTDYWGSDHYRHQKPRYMHDFLLIHCLQAIFDFVLVLVVGSDCPSVGVIIVDTGQ